MSRRCLDGLIVLWMIAACLYLSSTRELRAAPAPTCDKECRHILVGCSDKLGNGVISCQKYEYPECNICSIGGGGCVDSLPKLNGSCQKALTQPQNEVDVVGIILCPTPAKSNASAL